MKDVVRAVFYDFNIPMEGDIPFFYLDVKGLVSIGVGLLCDPIQLAMNLPMVHPDGRPASRNDIASEWMRIKSLPADAKGRTAAQLGHLYAKPYTTLRLTDEGLRLTLESKLNQHDAILRERFPDFETWPADAQLATHSLSWACGPRFAFPKCEAALRRRDFRTAAVECFMPEERTISGLRPRNKANRILFSNAAAVEEGQCDADTLYYPRDLTVAPIDREAETLPDLSVVVDFDVVHPDVPLGDDDDEPPQAA